ncbi:heterokaryon incompatibility protein-domain-containing protein [Xylariales sp. AK1849]|nr:heterokaryon incompatibility protein-domain-containing protein [Xylariales sp. AK1849]
MSIRLLDTNNLHMKVFAGDGIPNYAILSHTWVEDEEVSYQEMTRCASDPDHPAMEKSGYNKILKTCQKARSHNIKYAWVDTCCIDKTSSAELSEAINSMFKWYQNSQVCYALLSDMSPDMDVTEDLPGCRWFTRGWCLQELLAPEDLRFYDSAWEYVGSKEQLKDMISDITNIDEEVLADSQLLNSFAVGRRMSWAAMRVTTRMEDMAYCLLGMFDVNMPLLYGEGNKAFLRLQEEIIKRSNDMSIFAFLAKPSYGGDTDSSDDDDNDDSTARPPPYCDLFASAPSDFKNCGMLMSTSDNVMSSGSFTLTNNGLYFRAVEFLVGGDYDDYILPLQGGRKRNTEYNEEDMYLQKVGPSRFVRLKYPLRRERRPRGLYNYSEIEEAYIITSVTPAIRANLDPPLVRSIRIKCEGSYDLRDAIQSASPRDRWDSSSLKFLTGGVQSFEGHLKIFPSLMNLGYQTTESEYFYLLCGIEWNDEKETAWADVRSISQAAPWVALFSAKEWERLERKLGKMAGRFSGMNL